MELLDACITGLIWSLCCYFIHCYPSNTSKKARLANLEGALYGGLAATAGCLLREWWELFKEQCS